MNARLITRTAAALLLTSLPSLAQTVVQEAPSDQELVQSDPKYDAERERLRDQPPVDINFNKANLRDVLRLLATKAGIHFMVMADNKEWDKQLVTIMMRMSPFAALETIANEHGIVLVLDKDVWHLRPLNDKEMITRAYVVKYNTAERATGGGGGGGDLGGGGGTGGGGGLGGGGGGGFGGGGGGFGGGGGGGGSGGGGLGGLDLGSSGGGLQVENDLLVEGLEKLLGSSSGGFDPIIADNVSVDEFSQSPLFVPSKPTREAGAAGGDKNGEAKITWIDDTNTLIVVGTRAQHKTTELYLKNLDKPMPLVAVEMKFVETTKDPRTEMGIDWSGALAGGLQLSMENLQSNINLNDFQDSKWPTNAAILTPDQLNVKLNFLLTDRESSNVSYPRVLTMSHREVSMRSVVNFPVLAAQSSVSGGVGGTTSSSVAFMPIGTTVNILPKVIDSNKVMLHAKIVVATVQGSEEIDGNTYPVPSSRVYSAQLKVQNGYTVAIAGLDEAIDNRNGTGIPIVSRIPVLGWAFKNSNHTRSRKNLMIFITPHILNPQGRGVSEQPSSDIPRYADDQPTPAPVFEMNGELRGGVDALRDSVTWADREERRLRQVCQEGRGTVAVRGEISRLSKTINALQSYAVVAGQADPARGEAVAYYKYNLDAVSRRTWTLMAKWFKDSIHTPGLHAPGM